MRIYHKPKSSKCLNTQRGICRIMVIMYKRRQNDLSSVYNICKNQDGFVLLSSVNHIGFEMCSHNQPSTRLSCISKVASVIQPYIVLILTEVL